MKNLGDFLSLLEKEREIVSVDVPVDPHLEIAEIHRRVIEKEGPALLFKNVKGSSFPVVTNLFGTSKRVNLAFGKAPEIVLKELLHLATREFPTVKKLWKARHSLKKLFSLGTKRITTAPVQACQAQSLNELPFLTSWPEDGGPFLTLPLVYTESPSGRPPNLGMYRIQRFDGHTTGLHFQIGKGGGFHLYEAEERNVPLPVSIFLGGPPALILGAIAPLPENIPELLFTSFVSGGKLGTTRDSDTGNFIIGEAEFALLGEARPHERRDEGPFGDHYGYYSLTHPFPVFHCKKVLHRKGAVYPATIVGKPRQEDFFIGDYLQELMSPLFPIVMPGVKDLWSYGETGFHALAGAVVHERYKREMMAHAFRILGEGQLAFTKFLLLTNQSIPLKPFKPFFQAILERFRPETDLYIFPNLSLDTLDYTGPRLNEGSRAVLIGAGEKIRDLPERLEHPLPLPFEKGAPYCPGCLVIEAKEAPRSLLLNDPHLKKWPLVILVDSLKETLENDTSFLWSVFTRFDPARDIYANVEKVEHHHPLYQLPLLIDARQKGYPAVVTADDATISLVDRRWSSYFSQ